MDGLSKHHGTRGRIEFLAWTSIISLVVLGLIMLSNTADLYEARLYRGQAHVMLFSSIVVLVVGPIQTLVWRSVFLTILDSNDRIADLPTGDELSALMNKLAASGGSVAEPAPAPRASARPAQKATVAVKAWVCPSCSKKNDPRSGFCHACATPMPTT